MPYSIIEVIATLFRIFTLFALLYIIFISIYFLNIGNKILFFIQKLLEKLFTKQEFTILYKIHIFCRQCDFNASDKF